MQPTHYEILAKCMVYRRLLEKYEQYKRQQEAQSQEAEEELGEMEEILTPDEMEKAERVKKSIEKCVIH